MTKKPKSEALTLPKTKTPKSEPVSFEKKFIEQGPAIVLKKQAVSYPVQSRIRMYMRWSTERKDVLGRWSWGARRWTRKVWKLEMLPFLLDCEKKKWFELELEKSDGDKKHKGYVVNKICSEAQRRLLEIKLDDLDHIFRFRLSNKQRMYGFLIQHVFYVLWWDPEHNIYPTNVQNRGKIRLGPV